MTIGNKQGKLIVISAPSGAGKTTLVSALLNAMPDLKLSISHTTRPKRPGEQDGVNYYFVSQDEFKHLLDSRDFLEYAKVYDYYYGTSKVWVEEELSRGSNVILEIDWQGAQQIKAMYKDAVFIYILPPSLGVLRERLEKRAQDKSDVIEKRLSKAQEDISHCGEFDYLVVNDDLAKATSELKAIITSLGLTTVVQKKTLNKLLKELLD